MERKIHRKEFLSAMMGGVIGAVLVLAFTALPIENSNHSMVYVLFSGVISAVLAIMFCFASRQRGPNPEFGEITCRSLRVIDRDSLGEVSDLVYVGNDHRYGGAIRVIGNSGGEAKMCINEHGGQVYVCGKFNHETWNEQKAQASMGVDKDGIGVVGTSDTDGDRTTTLT